MQMNQERGMTKEILKMVAGFRRFRERFYREESSVYDRLSSSGQKPKTLMIACSDSRVDPAILFFVLARRHFRGSQCCQSCSPFESNQGFHGVSAAIEFAVVNLEVENIVVLGHRQCGGIRSLFQKDSIQKGGFVAQWMTIAEEAKEKVIKKLPSADMDVLCRECERESIAVSIQNLRSFPFIEKAIKDRGVHLYGVYFDLENGQLWYYNETANTFDELTIQEHRRS